MGLSERKVKRQLVGSAVTSNAAWTANGALPGQRMLASMGWSQGQGLGVNQQGSAAPISVAFKLDNKGLGVIRAEKEARKAGNTSSDWLGGGSDYEALLQRLNAANSQPASPSANIEEEATVEEAVTTVDSKKEKKKKSKKRKSSEDDDASDNEARTADDSSKKKRKKSKKEEGKRKDADNTDSSSPEPAAILTTVAVATVTKPAAPHRLAHRAKFLRAKGLLGPDSRSSPVSGSGTPIPQSPSPAPASPAPVSENVPADQADDAEISLKKKEKKKSKKGKSKADDDEQQQADAEEVTVTVEATVVTQSTNGELSDKARRKAEKAAAKEAKKAAKKAAKLAGAPVIESPESEESETPPIAAKESPKPIITDPFDDPVEPPPSQLSVQAYLANKLIRRKAEVARAKRETEQAMWARAAGATAASS
ncbi:hypothetical protein OC846_005195 [Tilletia horrida]|uniref:PinX1-related protein 1 n=1 Tax=Tilletia horrida TaxID=155126 RepID=A0AAN6JPS2_9BASI|nr:hypothetical protein OC846_005195 [Tilletia horrida]KAK0562378.1 hypothetical protein OC861_005353 [Tilletia horrida]